MVLRLENIDVGTLDPDECWEWRGVRSPTGYGRYGDNLYAHRGVYERFIGPIPPGKFVLHLCDNPSCCNPWHIELGSSRKNAQQMVDRGRHYSPWTSQERQRHGFASGGPCR